MENISFFHRVSLQQGAQLFLNHQENLYIQRLKVNSDQSDWTIELWKKQNYSKWSYSTLVAPVTSVCLTQTCVTYSEGNMCKQRHWYWWIAHGLPQLVNIIHHGNTISGKGWTCHKGFEMFTMNSSCCPTFTRQSDILFITEWWLQVVAWNPPEVNHNNYLYWIFFWTSGFLGKTHECFHLTTVPRRHCRNLGPLVSDSILKIEHSFPALDIFGPKLLLHHFSWSKYCRSYNSLGIALWVEMKLWFIYNWEIEINEFHIQRLILIYFTHSETFWFLSTTGCYSQQSLAVLDASDHHHSWPRDNKIWVKPFRRSSSGTLSFSKRLCKTMGCNHVPQRWGHRTKNRQTCKSRVMVLMGLKNNTTVKMIGTSSTNRTLAFAGFSLLLQTFGATVLQKIARSMPY